MIYFPDIRIRTKGQLKTFPLSNGHHKLFIAADGNIQFYNIQCGDGTGEYGGYEFLGREGLFFEMFGQKEINLLEPVDVIGEIALHFGFFGTSEHVKIVATMQEAIDKAIIRRETELQQMTAILKKEDETDEEIAWRKNLRSKRVAKTEQSIIDLARQCNMSPSCYSDIEVGRKKPTAEQKERIDAIVKGW
jgi:hypothetical protein